MDQHAQDDALLALAAQVQAVADLHREAAAGVLEGYGLRGSAAGLLWVLALDPSPSTMRQLASRLRCDPSNVTLLAERLEEAGLAERVSDSRDGRRRVLRLSPRGHHVWSQVRTAVLAATPLARLRPPRRAELSAALGAELG